VKQDDQREEAERALRRMDGQAEKILGHREAEPTPEDKVEILGRRIGRALSVVLAIALIIYLWRTYFSG
jgi:hypothetical protein